MRLGFIGLGVMGAPMCRNLAAKSGAAVLAFDLLPERVPRGSRTAGSPAELARESDVVFLALPGGTQLAQLSSALLAEARPGLTVVDCGTSPVALTRELAARFGERGAAYADAPIARTRQAAEDGTLSIMVGADEAIFTRIRPLLAHMASDITHCGPVGSGQIANIMNNMVLIQTVVALSEAIAVARRAGMDGAVLLDALAKGSADSFALRNHAAKAVLPGIFPERAFSAEYALKDLGYALELAREAGLALPGAELATGILRRAIAAGDGALYWPVISRVIGVA